MKFARPVGFRVLPHDGLVRLGPGEKLNIQHHALPNPSHDDALAAVQRARATILARTFAVENELVIAILADKFSTEDPQYGGPKYLQAEAQLRRSTLGAKVTPAIQMLGREGVLTEALRIDLRELLTVRNALAHQPCWLEPINSEEGLTTAFIGKIANEESIWSIDTQQIEEWEALIERCLAVRTATMEMLEKRDRAQVKYDLGGWPVSVRLPPGDPLGHRSPIEGIGLKGAQLIVQSADHTPRRL